MKKLLFLLMVALASTAAAQSPRSFDGSINVGAKSPAGGPDQHAAAPPIVVVSGTRTAPTGWNPSDSGVLTMKGINSGSSQSVVINPGATSMLAGSSAGQPAAILRTGADKRVGSFNSACPEYHSGSITWQQEEIRSVTAPEWRVTGPKFNEVNSCTPIVETRWVGASGECPQNYTGVVTWEREERRVGGGPWTPTGNTANRNAACVGMLQSRWVAASAACPAGQTGANTWEAEEQRHGDGAWSATGAIRNASNTCVPDRNPGTNPPITGTYIEALRCDRQSNDNNSYDDCYGTRAMDYWPEMPDTRPMCYAWSEINANPAPGHCALNKYVDTRQSPCTKGTVGVVARQSTYDGGSQSGSMNDFNLGQSESIQVYECR